MNPRMRRRAFLRGGASLLAVAPFASLLDLRRANAQGKSPTRALFVYIPDGCIPDRFHPTGSETGFALSPMTMPLAPVKQHCVFLDGLDMFSGGTTHEGGMAKVLTGVGPQSLDVYLGQQLGRETPHASVQLGIGANFQDGSGSMSYIGEGQQVKADDDPLHAFDRLFGGAAMGPNADEAALLARRKRSVLDTALADVQSLQRALGASEREKLEIHLASLRELERRLTDNAAAVCDVSRFNEGGYVNIRTDYYPDTYEKEENLRVVGELQMDLAVHALACNVTRVASIQWSHAVSPTHVLETGIASGHHDASHYGSPTTAMAADFTTLKQWFVARVADLIERLDSTPDGDGQTLLDNTVLLLCSELGDSNRHDHKRVPFVVAGRAGGRIETGRFLDFRGKGQDGENETHTKLLVSIARAMGQPISRFGYTGHGTGELPGLLR